MSNNEFSIIISDNENKTGTNCWYNFDILTRQTLIHKSRKHKFSLESN